MGLMSRAIRHINRARGQSSFTLSGHSEAIRCNHVHSEAIGGSAHHGAPHRKALAVLRLVGDVDEEGDARRVAREERRDERHVQVHAFQNERLVRQLERGDEALNMAREQLRERVGARAPW